MSYWTRFISKSYQVETKSSRRPSSRRESLSPGERLLTRLMEVLARRRCASFWDRKAEGLGWLHSARPRFLASPPSAKGCLSRASYLLSFLLLYHTFQSHRHFNVKKRLGCGAQSFILLLILCFFYSVLLKWLQNVLSLLFRQYHILCMGHPLLAVSVVGSSQLHRRGCLAGWAVVSHFHPDHALRMQRA